MGLLDTHAVIEARGLKKNNLRIISIEPSDRQSFRAGVNQFCKEHNIDIEELKDKVDIINGSPIGGISINSMRKKQNRRKT